MTNEEWAYRALTEAMAMSKEKAQPEAEEPAPAPAEAEDPAAYPHPSRDLGDRVKELERRVDELEDHTQAPARKHKGKK